MLFSSILYIANKHLLKIINILESPDNVENSTRGNKSKEDANEETSIEYSKIRQVVLGWLARTERNYYRYFLPPYYSKMGKDELSLFLD